MIYISRQVSLAYLSPMRFYLQHISSDLIVDSVGADEFRVFFVSD